MKSRDAPLSTSPRQISHAVYDRLHYGGIAAMASGVFLVLVGIGMAALNTRAER